MALGRVLSLHLSDFNHTTGGPHLAASTPRYYAKGQFSGRAAGADNTFLSFACH